MRIAIVSDIHSNLQALTKALELIDGLKVDAIYCLGDIVGYGGNPNECINLVRERISKCVLGNHDLAAVDTSQAEGFTRHGKIAAEWTHGVLTAENTEYLSKLSYRIEIPPATLVHANPSAPELWNYVFSLQDAGPQFERFTTPVCFIGHTHVPSLCGEDLRTFSLTKSVRFLINVGSIGQPRDHNPQLSFGLLDSDAWTYENVRAAYDIQGAAQAILDSGLPRPLAKRLFSGV